MHRAYRFFLSKAAGIAGGLIEIQLPGSLAAGQNFSLSTLIATLGAKTVIGAKLVAAGCTERRQCRGCFRGRCFHRCCACLFGRCYHVSRFLLLCRCGSLLRRLLLRSRCACRYGLGLVIVAQSIIFIMTHRILALGTVHKTICIPGTEIQRVIRILYYCLAVLTCLLVSQTAMPFCSFESHI